MDFEPWWLIVLPVLFGLGWLAARFDFKQILSESRNLPDSYFKGLNFLLNEQPDRAIDAFVEVAKLDSETTELHFALGSLFRRRGEIERAIRVHQSLLARADLPAQDRETAQHELAQDFLKAGLLDRAEQAFEAVVDTRFAVDAMRSLIRIYESEHDWPQAIEAVRRLRAFVDEPVPQLVHYQCEQAQSALEQRQPDLPKAEEALKEADLAAEALGEKNGSAASRARIAILRAKLSQLKGDFPGQRDFLASVMRVAPEYTGLIAADLMACYRQLDQPAQGLGLLKAHYEALPSIDIFNVVFRELREQQGHVRAWAFARTALRMQPLLLGLDRMLEVELTFADNLAAAPLTGAPIEALPASAAADVVAGADLGLLRRLVHKHTQRLDRYSCHVCGFEAQHYYWQCPGCNSWETYAPKRLEEMQ